MITSKAKLSCGYKQNQILQNIVSKAPDVRNLINSLGLAGMNLWIELMQHLRILNKGTTSPCIIPHVLHCSVSIVLQMITELLRDPSSLCV